LADVVCFGADEPADFIYAVERFLPRDWPSAVRDKSIEQHICQEPRVVIELDVVDWLKMFVELILNVGQTDTSRQIVS